jgi:hypothetical protein
MFSSCRSSVALLTVVIALVAAAAGAPGASAAGQRYAGPNGAGTDCSLAKPCRVDLAINGAHDGDEVVVTPGNYFVEYPIETKAPVSIHGVAGQPRPKLYLNSSSLMKLTDARLDYVEVIQNSPTYAALSSLRSKLNQVILRGGQQAGCAAGVYNGTVVNSIVVARNASGDAICVPGYGALNSTSVLNVTAIAGNGDAIAAFVGNPGSAAVVDAVNVIAKATGATGAGFVADATAGGLASITVLHSNYLKSYSYGAGGQVVSLGSNQSFAPAFVDEAGGDYRQKPVSLTIDAGKADARLGLVDVDGDPRDVGTTDIGADEYVPAPTATTGPASAVGDRTATLTGTVNPKGAPTSYRFEYGPTTAYGNSTADSGAGSVLTDVTSSANVAGLAPATTYHYRAVASSAGGVVHGADRTFTTAPATGTGSPGSFAGVKLVSSRLALRRGFIVLRLSCPAGTAGECAGTTKLTARRPRTASRAAANVKLGRARFSIAAGGRAKLKVRVSRAGRRLFAHRRRLRGLAANAAHDAAGVSKATSARVTIRKGTR